VNRSRKQWKPKELSGEVAPCTDEMQGYQVGSWVAPIARSRLATATSFAFQGF